MKPALPRPTLKAPRPATTAPRAAVSAELDEEVGAGESFEGEVMGGWLRGAVCADRSVRATLAVESKAWRMQSRFPGLPCCRRARHRTQRNSCARRPFRSTTCLRWFRPQAPVSPMDGTRSTVVPRERCCSSAPPRSWRRAGDHLPFARVILGAALFLRRSIAGRGGRSRAGGAGRDDRSAQHHS